MPSGRNPTTHILKPPTSGLEGHAENEVFCLRLAEHLGLRTARAEVMTFAGERAIVIRRYDRVQDPNGRIVRIHQEDLCQAMGIAPGLKYQKDGGPGIPEIMNLLSRSSNPAADRTRFMKSVAVNFVIAGTDAHSRNFSILFGPGQARLAPLYDIASYLPYFKNRWEDVRMPMKIDKYYNYAQILPRHMERMVKSCGYPRDEAMSHIADIVTRLPAAAQSVASTMQNEGINHPVLDILVERMTWRCNEIKHQWDITDPMASLELKGKP